MAEALPKPKTPAEIAQEQTDRYLIYAIYAVGAGVALMALGFALAVFWPHIGLVAVSMNGAVTVADLILRIGLVVDTFGVGGIAFTAAAGRSIQKKLAQ